MVVARGDFMGEIGRSRAHQVQPLSLVGAGGGYPIMDSALDFAIACLCWRLYLGQA